MSCFRNFYGIQKQMTAIFVQTSRLMVVLIYSSRCISIHAIYIRDSHMRKYLGGY